MSQAQVELRAKIIQMEGDQYVLVPDQTEVSQNETIPDVSRNETVPNVGQNETDTDVSQNEITITVQHTTLRVEAPMAEEVTTTEAQDPGPSADVQNSSEEVETAQNVVYQCQHCSLLFTSQPEILEHLETHLAPKNVKTFENQPKQKMEELDSAVATAQAGNPLDKFKKFDCRYCGESFKLSADLESHKLTHVSDKFECLDCGKFFSAKHSLKLHERIHTGERPFSCNQCGKSFAQQQHLVYHEMSHSGEKPFSCSVCSKRFVHQAAVTMHMRTHTGEKPFECDLCGKRFKQRQHLMYHGQTHTDTKPFHCELCDKGFSHLSSLKTHQKIHSGERPFKCEVCPKTFVQKQHMQYHMGIHTGIKQFKCDQCDKSFVHNVALKVHIRNNHTDHSKKRCCEICRKWCANPSSLQAHLKTHRKDRAYACSLCERTFTNKQHLAYHMATHTGLKKIRCCECGFRFVHKTGFGVHNRSRHENMAVMSVDCLKCGLGFDDDFGWKQHQYVCPKKDEEPVVPEPNDSVTGPSEQDCDSGPSSTQVTPNGKKSTGRRSKRTPKPKSYQDMELDASVCLDCGQPENSHIGSVCPSVQDNRSKKAKKRIHPDSNSENAEDGPVKSEHVAAEDSDINVDLEKIPKKSVKKCPTVGLKPKKRVKKTPTKSKQSPAKKVKRSRKSSTPKQAVTCTTATSVDNAMSYKCLECGSTFVEVSDLISHIHSHAKKPTTNGSKDVKPNVSKSDVGNENVASDSKDNIGDFECPECGEMFSRMVNLEAHLRSHSVEDPLLAN